MLDYRELTCMAVWYFHEAPQELRDLSGHGGDEDYVAYVPPNCFDLLTDDWFGYMRENDDTGEYTVWKEHNGTAFGCCSISRHELDNGGLVFIGAHA